MPGACQQMRGSGSPDRQVHYPPSAEGGLHQYRIQRIDPVWTSPLSAASSQEGMPRSAVTARSDAPGATTATGFPSWAPYIAWTPRLSRSRSPGSVHLRTGPGHPYRHPLAGEASRAVAGRALAPAPNGASLVPTTRGWPKTPLCVEMPACARRHQVTGPRRRVPRAQILTKRCVTDLRSRFHAGTAVAR